MENTEDKPKRRQILKGDRIIWTMVILLCCISLIEVFSASSRLTFGKSSYLAPIISHTIHLCAGILVMYVMHLFDYKWYKLFPVILVPISIVLLAYLAVQSRSSDGAERWINLGFFQLQPSELGKMAVIMSVAFWLSKLKADDPLRQSNTFWKIIVLTGVVCALIVGENLSTAVLLAAVIYVMMILGGIAWRRMLALTGVVAVVGVFAVLLLLLVPSQTLRDSPIIPSRAVTWQARIQDFSNSNSEAKQTAEEYARLTATDKPQETHANIAIATSNVFGKMPGNSDERDYLQEASCDFIYAIIIEELGMVGGIVVMLVYMILLFRVGRIATRCKEKYPAYLAMGIGMLLGLQAFINMSVAVGLFPVTGQPLPLISKGGTSVLITSAFIGMLLGISNTLDRQEAGEQALGGAIDVPEPIEGNESFDDTTK